MTREPPSAAKMCVTCGASYPGDALFCPSDGTPLQSGRSVSSPDKETHDPYLGREISGHIEIRQLAGVGAMGRVYRAFQTGIDRDVAVKILHRELSANEQLVARFTREAKVASRLQHPNVVQVLLSGQLPDGSLYIVMEYLDGMSLQSALAAASGSFPLARALHVAFQLCDAAGEAHAQGIVHRDLKPENVMLVRRGEDSDYVKVLDFGIARVNWGEQTMETAAGLIFGTARYISPEGAQGSQVGPQGDVYSIATLLYQMLSGRTPFEGAKAVGLLIQQIHDPPPPLTGIERAKYVPKEIADLVMRNLAKDPNDRDPDARAFGRALLRAARASGFASDETRPTLERRPLALQLPPTHSTKPLQLTPPLAEEMAQPPVVRPSDRPPVPRSDPFARPPTMETFKWSPPSEPPPPLAPPPQRLSGTEIAEAPLVPEAAARAPSKPVSNVETTLSDADANLVERRLRGRRILVATLMALLIGLGVAALFGRRPPTENDAAALNLTAAKASDALSRRHYTEPPDDNVLEITSSALRRWPGNERLLDLRERAADALVTEALTERYAGNLDLALKKAQDAHRLDESDTSAIALASQYAIEVEARDRDAVAPLPRAAPLAPPAPTTSWIQDASAPSRVSLDASAVRAKVGQSVEFLAHVTAKGKVENPELVITGPGVRGAHVPATNEGPGLYRARFAFLEPGSFEVVFIAKHDSGALRVAKQIAVGDGPAPAAAPTGSVKWM